MHAFIEIEEYHFDSDLEHLVRLVNSCGMRGQCSFICFNADDLRKVRAIDNEVPLGFLSAEPPSAKDIELARRLKPMFLDYDYNQITPDEVRACREAGIEVSLWTINRYEDSLRFIDAGVDYITTDTLLIKESM
jgi:glycerophosphoryl diester phosphodiesterase